MNHIETLRAALIEIRDFSDDFGSRHMAVEALAATEEPEQATIAAQLAAMTAENKQLLTQYSSLVADGIKYAGRNEHSVLILKEELKAVTEERDRYKEAYCFATQEFDGRTAAAIAATKE